MYYLSFALAIVAAVSTILIGVTVWLGEQRSSLHRSFVLLSLYICGWILTNVAFSAIGDPDIKFNLALMSYAFAMGVAVQLYVFSLTLASKFNGLATRFGVVMGYVIAVLSALPGVVGTGVQGDRIVTNAAPLALYGLTLVAFLAFACAALVSYRKSQVTSSASFVNVVFAGMAISSIFGAAFNLVLPLNNIYDYTLLGPASAVIFVLMIAYAIIRYGLFDIRFAAVRTLAYILALSTLAVIYYLLAYLVSFALMRGDGEASSVSVSPIDVMLALLLAFIFQPVKRFFDKVTDGAFFRHQYDPEEFYGRFSSALASTTDLRVLLERAASEIERSFKAEQVFFLYRQHGRYTSAGTKKHSKMPLKDAQALDEYVNNKSPEVIVSDLLKSNEATKRLMHSHRIDLLLPLVNDSQIVGYLALGEHKTSKYTNRDIRTIMTISDELVIAVQNSLSIQAVKELNATLQQRISEATKELRRTNARLRHLDATKDEFISMASHQLRTPLTSVKGYLSMLLEGDAGKISVVQKKFLEEAFSSSERMVHLIGDFLNVSRLQTGKFVIDKKITNLDRIVEQEVDNLSRTAASREIKLEYEKPISFPEALLDEAKIRQVVMNFLDNAIYYSPAGASVRAHLSLDGNDITFKVVDSGIGVPKDEQAGLFGKFYRASNARRQRPDGTGVGLFLAKKVVNAHGGEIIFESTEKKGSTFGFKLPLIGSSDD